jgi:UDP-N-acetylglucosamine 1-carboxyvinyltransferase
LVVAGLAAEGITEIEGLRHLDRGYENMEQTLQSIGAVVKRI